MIEMCPQFFAWIKLGVSGAPSLTTVLFVLLLKTLLLKNLIVRYTLIVVNVFIFPSLAFVIYFVYLFNTK